MSEFSRNCECSRSTRIFVVSVVSIYRNLSGESNTRSVEQNCSGDRWNCDRFCRSRQSTDSTSTNFCKTDTRNNIERCTESNRSTKICREKNRLLRNTRNCEELSVFWSLCNECLCCRSRSGNRSTANFGECISLDERSKLEDSSRTNFGEGSSFDMTTTDRNCTNCNLFDDCSFESFVFLGSDANNSRSTRICIVSVVSIDTNWSSFCNSLDREQTRTTTGSCRNKAFLTTKLDTIEITNSSVIIDNTVGLSTNTCLLYTSDAADE